MRILNSRDIHALTGVAGLIEPVAEAMIRVSEGRTDMPLRSMVRVGETRLFGIMTGAMQGPDTHGAKLLSLYPDNPRHGRSSHCGVVVVFDHETGLPTGCVDAASLTALRTAAASAVATRALARPDATRLALLGCGEQAHIHIEAMRAVRPIKDLVVWGRDPGRVAAFAEANGCRIAGTVAEAVAEADIVVSATPATTPFLMRAHLRPGTHVNAVGASIPTMQELETAIVPAVRFVTDFRPSLEAQAAEVIDARRLGLVPESERFTEIGEILAGTRPGRADDREVTLYRSLGVAAQDLAGATAVLAMAAKAGRGVEVDWT